MKLLSENPTWVYDDGGRNLWFKGTTGDCVTRSIAIAADLPYKEVYDELHARYKARPSRKRQSTSPRDGMPRRIYEPYLFDLGFTWLPLVHVGSGCKVHLTREELAPLSDILIARCSRHLCAVLDGIIHDTFDPSRDGTRCVYGVYER